MIIGYVLTGNFLNLAWEWRNEETIENYTIDVLPWITT